MDDVISRQAAVDALHRWFADIGFEEDRWWNSTHVLAAIKSVPSAQPERKKGYWKRLDDCEYRCSECGKIIFADDPNERNYCCCCGADMRGDE